MPRYQDVPQFTRSPAYHVNVMWSYLEQHIIDNQEAGAARLDLDPDFQRGHKWNDAQRSRYVEYIMRGGISGRAVYLNCVGWNKGFRGPYVLVDGKQRLNAVRMFLADKIPAFGHYCSEYTDKPRFQCNFDWYVNDLETRAEVLQWYLDLNDGGVVHTSEEIERVRGLLEIERKGA